LRQELNLNIATLELDDVGNEWVSVVKKVWESFQKRVSKEWIDPEYEFALKGGVIHVGRYQPLNVLQDLGTLTGDKAAQDLRLAVGTPELLQTLHWAPVSDRTIGRDEILISPKCAGINFKVCYQKGDLLHSSSDAMLGCPHFDGDTRRKGSWTGRLGRHHRNRIRSR
jgi:hypothetical protein